jgi:hypothetical protein
MMVFRRWAPADNLCVAGWFETCYSLDPDLFSRSIRCRTLVVSSPEQILLGQRTPCGYLLSLRSKLGKAAVIGGRAYVERFATSDEFAAIFMYGLDPAGRKEALDMVVRIGERAPRNPPPLKAPSSDERVKVWWTDELIARLKIEAPKSTDDIDLARRLGLPPICRGAMRAMRSRCGLLRGRQTGDAHSPPQTGAPVAPLQAAA